MKAYGIGERRQERGRRIFETEDDRVLVGRFDLVDHRVITAARADDPGRRRDDLVPARRHVIGRERRVVGEFNVGTNSEGIGSAVVHRLGDFGADIAHEVGRRGRVLRIDPDQHAVERRDRVDRRERVLAVAVPARRRVGRDHVGQRAAALRRLPRNRRHRCAEQSHQTRHNASVHLSLLRHRLPELPLPGSGASERVADSSLAGTEDSVARTYGGNAATPFRLPPRPIRSERSGVTLPRVSRTSTPKLAAFRTAESSPKWSNLQSLCGIGSRNC